MSILSCENRALSERSTGCAVHCCRLMVQEVQFHAESKETHLGTHRESALDAPAMRSPPEVYWYGRGPFLLVQYATTGLGASKTPQSRSVIMRDMGTPQISTVQCRLQQLVNFGVATTTVSYGAHYVPLGNQKLTSQLSIPLPSPTRKTS